MRLEYYIINQFTQFIVKFTLESDKKSIDTNQYFNFTSSYLSEISLEILLKDMSMAEKWYYIHT